jgi:hypothetical protein
MERLIFSSFCVLDLLISAAAQSLNNESSVELNSLKESLVQVLLRASFVLGSNSDVKLHSSFSNYDCDTMLQHLTA